jgi:DNA repair protein RadC
MSKMQKVPIYRLKLVKDRVMQLTEASLTDSFGAARLVERLIRDADRETLVAVCLDAECQVLGINIVAMGTLVSLSTTGREIFKGAIAANAFSIILGHNHPSGDLEPSQEDIAMTRRAVLLGKMLSIPVLDHVVVSRRGYTSMRQRGIVPKPDRTPA